MTISPFYVTDHMMPLVAFSTTFGKMTYNFITRQPQQVYKFDQILKSFDLDVWIAVILSLVTLSIIFKIIHAVYSNLNLKNKLVKKVDRQSDFLILTLSSLTEPDGLPWFPKHSGGKEIN